MQLCYFSKKYIEHQELKHNMLHFQIGEISFDSGSDMYHERCALWLEEVLKTHL